MGHARRNFMGAKIALFVGDRLVVLQRDDRPGLLWPGYWDLPGGGREGRESPLACVRRETFEELSLDVPDAHVRWARDYTNSIGRSVWFFVGHLSAEAAQTIRLGDEGQQWALMHPAEFGNHSKAVPQFVARMNDYLNGVSGVPFH